ncbi:MAG: multidrug efflux RND transporter permease subunit [Bacteroidaceae bacterium]|nr:multidrug efflux RND transporter permease subunit [Bacteroidaceae bacterium]
MSIPKFFIRRPIFATVLSLLLLISGIVCLFVLPIDQYPAITPPTVQVNAVYPGANAETIAQTVGIPIEQQVNGVDNMLYMSSTSSSSGTYQLTVTFEVGTDIDMATVLVQNRVNIALNSLPSEVTQQGVTVQKQSSNIVLFITLAGDSLYNQLYLSNYAQLQIVDQLTRTKGVGTVNIMGAGKYSMRIWLDPEAMRIRGISPAQVYDAVSKQNLAVSAGYVGQTLSNNADNAFQYTLNIEGRLQDAEEFANIVIKNDGVDMLRLRDIARIEVGSESYSSSSRLKGRPCAALAVYQSPGSSSLAVAKAVKAKMEELAKELPPAVEYSVTLDTTDVVRSSIREVLYTFLEATVLVILVIFLFLQSWRATIIPCLTIPISLIGTLAIMELLGFSINTLTLFGLILAIAIVVDDAIVVVENVSRIMDEENLSPRAATEKAMDEITSPIIGVVLVMMAVFIPTTMISGISGQLYKQFALTIAASTLLSGINSLTLTPALCAIMLRPTPKNRDKKRLFSLFNKSYSLLQRLFDNCCSYLLRRSGITALLFIIMVVVALFLFYKWPTTFIPEEDDGYAIISVQLPPAASLSRTEAVTRRVEKILDSYPEIKTNICINGFSIMNNGEQSNAATFFVVFEDWKKRKKKNQSVEAVVERFNRQAYIEVEEALCYAVVPPAIPGIGNVGGLQLQLEDRKALGTTEMQKGVKALLEEFYTKPQIASMTSSYEANVPQYLLKIDRDKAISMGLNIGAILSTLSYYMGAVYVNDFTMLGRIWQVKMSASEKRQKEINDVLALSLANNRGEMVPFSSFMTIEGILGIDQMNRYNMYNSAAITCNVAKGYSSGELMSAVEELAENVLGNEFGYEWTGVAFQEESAGKTTTIILVLALIVAYLVLAAQYESWLNPIAAVTGVPIALLGTILGCWIMDIPVSIYTQIGIILLIALSAKNGILIVEFARDYRKAGNDIRHSAFEAGHVRLRPILMTSFAFVLGVMPLLSASGAGAAARLSLGTAVVFGMLLNTVIATLFIPSWYEWAQTLEERILGHKPPTGESRKDTTI